MRDHITKRIKTIAVSLPVTQLNYHNTCIPIRPDSSRTKMLREEEENAKNDDSRSAMLSFVSDDLVIFICVLHCRHNNI
jgi:hypothetical protein